MNAETLPAVAEHIAEVERAALKHHVKHLYRLLVARVFGLQRRLVARRYDLLVAFGVECLDDYRGALGVVGGLSAPP